METIYKISVYTNDLGISPYLEWLSRIRDAKALFRIQQRMRRLEKGNFGDCKALGEGLFELRVDCGPGYRVYFSTYKGELIILFACGDKSSQQKDIEKSRQYKKDYETSQWQGK